MLLVSLFSLRTALLYHPFHEKLYYFSQDTAKLIEFKKQQCTFSTLYSYPIFHTVESVIRLECKIYSIRPIKI